MVGELFQGHLDGWIIASRAPCGVIPLPPPKSCTSLWESAAHHHLRDSWARWTGQIIFSRKETLRNSGGLGGVTDCMCTHQSVFSMYCMSMHGHTRACVSVCVHLRVCVFSQLGLISEQENHSEWFRGNCPQLQSQTHVVSQKSDRVRFTFQTSTSDRIQTIWKLCRNGPVVTHTCMQGLKASPWF